MARLAVDTNVVIYAIEKEAAFHQLAERIFLRARELGHELHVSELALMEAVSQPFLRDDEADQLQAAIRKLVHRGWPLDMDVLLRAAQIRRMNPRVKTPDAIHIATAIEHKCDYFLTNDQTLLRQDVPGIKIISITAVDGLAR